MSCFYRIWKMQTFCCLDPSNNMAALPSSAAAEMRQIAISALRSLEHDVLKELDACVAQQGTLKANERFVVWACMWQLMFLYRELVIAFEAYMNRIANARSELNEDMSRGCR